MATQEQFLSKRQRYQPISLPQDFSDEELARDWTLTEGDQVEIGKYRNSFRLYMAIQLCAVRVYGRFLTPVHDVSPRIANYLGSQLDLPPSLQVQVPEREATYLEHRQHILNHLGFQKFDEVAQGQLAIWLTQQAQLGRLPDALFPQAEHYLLDRRILLPGPSVLERLIIHSCAAVHGQLFESMFQRLAPALRQAIDRLLTVPEGEQRSSFYYLKEYPPAATISSIQSYLQRYQTVSETGIDAFEAQGVSTACLNYFFKLAKRYSAADLKRFADDKRYALMLAFLLETRKDLLDHLVTMHDQYIMEMCRQAKHLHEQEHRELRKRQRRAIDVVLEATDRLLDWPEEPPLSKTALWQQIDERKLRGSLADLRTFQRLEERGYGDILLARYPSLRKYFAEFIHLPFAAE